MRRHVMCPHVMSCHLLCPAMGWNVMSLRCHWLWGHVVWFEVVLWRCGDSKYYSVLLFATKYSSSTTLHYKVLLLYYFVLQSTAPLLLCAAKFTPVLLCTTKYYSTTTLYYKVLLLQYFSVLQSTTPWLLQSHSVLQSTTLCYKVLLQYYSVLQSTTPPVLLCTTIYSMTTPVPLCTTKCYSCTTPVLLCTTKCYSVLLQYFSVLKSATTYCSGTSLYYKVLLRYYSVLQSTTTKCSVLLQYYSVPQSNAHHWSSSHTKRHLQWAEQQVSPSYFTKNCACHAKSFSWLILLTYETSFTMRGATRVTLPLHQVPWIALRGATLVTFHHPPPSPHTAPATQNSNPKSKRHLLKTDETSFTLRGRFENIPNMIRPWTRHFAPARLPRLVFTLRRRILYWNLQRFVLRLSTQISPNAAPDITCCACHEKWHCNIAKWCPCHEKWHCNITKCCACHEKWHCNITKCWAWRERWLPWFMVDPATTKWTVSWLNGYWTVTLPNCYLTDLLLDRTLTELLLDWAVTLLNCYLILDWAVPVTELLLYWTVYLTELLLYSTVAWLNWYFAALLLFWNVTLLSRYFTEVLLCGAVVLMSCYFTQLLLCWAVTLLNCYFTELLLYWTVTLLSCYLTELLFYWILFIFKKKFLT